MSNSIERVLMYVKTYPTPSKAYGELVCTAGIRLSDRRWIRIYPYPFRLLAQDKRFRKGDVLVSQLVPAAGDPRPDSFRLYDTDAINIEAEEWKSLEERLHLAAATSLESVKDFQCQMLPPNSWGPSLRPVGVQVGSVEVTWEKDDPWTEKDLRKLRLAKDRAETHLFERQEFFRLLEKLPYRFYMAFTDMAGDRSRFLVLDWEIAMLYLNTAKRSAPDEALQQVKQKIEVDMFGRGGPGFVILGSINHHFRRRDAIAINGLLPDSLNRLNYGNSLLFE